jgi:N-acetylmuramoyl-L-alanine amidase
MFQVINKKLSGENVRQFNTTKKGAGINKRQFIVVHYTASDNFDGDVKTLSSSDKQVSCHLVISREGEVAMIGSFDDVQWHAGASQWRGINGLNSYSIGIEMTNPGWMEIIGDGVYQTYYGKKYQRSDGVVEATHKALGNKKYGWLYYSQKQLQTLQEIVDVLKHAYPSIKEVVGHEQISPGRKQDPGIGIILSTKLMEHLNGIDNSDDFYTGIDPDAEANKTSQSVPPGPSAIYRVHTSGGSLRVRSQASASAPVVGSENNGDLVNVQVITNGFAKIGDDRFVSVQYLEKAI